MSMALLDTIKAVNQYVWNLGYFLTIWPWKFLLIWRPTSRYTKRILVRITYFTCMNACFRLVMNCIEPFMYASSRHSQRDHCINRWRTAGTPAHLCTARGRNFTLSLNFLNCFSNRTELEAETFWQFSGSNRFIPLFFQQAERARSLGAIVYCVGVKDFNETQVITMQIQWIHAIFGQLTHFPNMSYIWFEIKNNFLSLIVIIHSLLCMH